MSLRTIDQSLFLAINRFAERTSGLHGFFLFLANEGLLLFVLLLFAAYAVAWLRGRLVDMAKVVCTGMAAVMAEGLNQPIAHLVKEPRPYDSLPHILVLIHRANDYSFPSDHGVMIGAVTAGLFLVSPVLGAVALALGLLVAFARVYTAAHYPHDLVAGILLGALATLLVYLLIARLVVAALRRLDKTPLRIFLHRNTDTKHVDTLSSAE